MIKCYRSTIAPLCSGKQPRKQFKKHKYLYVQYELGREVNKQTIGLGEYIVYWLQSLNEYILPVTTNATSKNEVNLSD